MRTMKVPRTVLGLALAVAILVLTHAESLAQSIDTTLWVTNGSVNAVVQSGGKIYIGGQFTRVGPASGCGIPIDGTSGSPVSGFPKVAGWVLAAVADGSGGWYIGGIFTTVGGLSRQNLAHIRADNSVSSWDPNPSGTVWSLTLSGPTLYVGGDFTTIGGQARQSIAALDVLTGLATSWNPGANSSVRSMVVSGPMVYAGGNFTNIGGQARNRIAALDAVTGLATAWNPNANQQVLALAVSGTTVYAGGNFTSIAGQTRSYLVALDSTGGLVAGWDPNPTGPASVLLLDGTTLYVGGAFSQIGGQARLLIAALDIATGLATSWNPGANGAVYALTVSGGTVYAGGGFTSIGGQARNNVAALDAVTGLATAWNPDPNAQVLALAASGTKVYVGGFFTGVAHQSRNRLAAFDAATGAATTWNPNANQEVTSLGVIGATVYAGGDFTSIGGQARNRLAALDTTTGLATAWNPSVSGALARVRALTVSGATVYVGGNFTTVGGQARNNLAALDATTGLATGWNPGASNDVYSLAASGTTVYVGGIFNVIGGQARNWIAAVDAATGLATAWNPNANGNVLALAVNGTAVYAGGAFVTIGGQTRFYVAALDAATGLATAWNPNPTNGPMRALATSGPRVYAAGDFHHIAGQSRLWIAALDVASGLASAWNPSPNSPAVRALALSGAKVYAGGDFVSIGGLPQAYLAAIAAEPTLSAVEPATGGNAGPVTIKVSGSGLPGGVAIRLRRSGQPDIPGTHVVVASDAFSLTATFDLDGAALGAWDLVVTTPDQQTGTLANGFTIELPLPRLVRVGVVGSALMRPERRRAYDIVIENPGNSDELSVPLWISRIPAGATIDLDFDLAYPPQSGGEPDWTTAPLTFAGPGGSYLALVIPRVPPGVVVRRIYLTVPHSVSGLELDAALTPPWENSALFRNCLSGGGVIGAPACVGTQLAANDAYLATTPGIEALSGIALWAKVAWQCEGAASLPAALAKAEQVMDYLLQPIERTSVPAGCEVPLVPRWQDTLAVTVVTSLDPNDKLGVDGRGPAREIGSQQLLWYSIRFENKDTVGVVPAQEVVVIDQLDGATLDFNTVILGEIKFGRQTNGLPWTVPLLPGPNRHSVYVDIRSVMPLIVLVEVDFDRVTGHIAWSLKALDPETLEPPDDPLVGFLPRNVTPPEGEGSLFFTVLPKSGTGVAPIVNRATITFDGASLVTADWSNTLDITPPESAVQPLPGNQDSASFTVRWQAVGGPPDLQNFSVYVSEDGISYRPWRTQTTATADTFSGPGGRTYSFYSLAQDSSGNLEPVPLVPDVQTFSRVGVGSGPGSLALALEGAVPNPAIAGALVWFTLPSRERAVLEVMDIAGRRLLRHEVGAMGPGRHSVDVGATARRPGLYFLRLAQGDRVRHARMVVIR